MSEPLTFDRDGIRLRGRLHRAKGGSRGPAVLLLHGGPGNFEDVLGLGARFAEGGHDTLTFNYTGTLESEGLSSFEATQLDIAAAWPLLEEPDRLAVDADRIVLGGWSYGGGMALTYAATHPNVDAVFSISGTDHAEFMREYWDDAEYRRMVDGIFDEFARPGSPWRLAPGATPKEILEGEGSMDRYDLVRLAPGLVDRDVLLVGGWDDTNVKIERHLLPLYRSLISGGSDRATILAFQDDHAFANTRKDLADTILTWLGAVGRRGN